MTDLVVNLAAFYRLIYPPRISKGGRLVLERLLKGPLVPGDSQLNRDLLEAGVYPSNKSHTRRREFTSATLEGLKSIGFAVTGEEQGSFLLNPILSASDKHLAALRATFIEEWYLFSSLQHVDSLRVLVTLARNPGIPGSKQLGETFGIEPINCTRAALARLLSGDEAKKNRIDAALQDLHFLAQTVYQPGMGNLEISYTLKGFIPNGLEPIEARLGAIPPRMTSMLAYFLTLTTFKDDPDVQRQFTASVSAMVGIHGQMLKAVAPTT